MSLLKAMHECDQMSEDEAFEAKLMSENHTGDFDSVTAEEDTSGAEFMQILIDHAAAEEDTSGAEFMQELIDHADREKNS